MRFLAPIFTLGAVSATIPNCFLEDANSVTCEDLDQNLSGLDTITWSDFGQIDHLKLKLDDGEAQVNQNNIPILENVLSDLSSTLMELTLIHFNNAINNQVLKRAPLLDTLRIINTQVDSLPDLLFKDTAIEYFKVSDSEIQNFNSKLFAQSNLKKLKFERNKLSTLEEDSFKHLKELEHLDLSDNDISEVHVDVMKYLKNLKKLDLENNGLSALPTEFLKKNVDLKHLSLAGNNIEELPCEFLKYQYELVSFNITNNKFSSLPCHVINRQGEQLILFDATNNLLHQRYNTDLSHKRGANFRLNKKGVKANGRVMTEILEDGTIEFVEGNENQIAGTMTMACQVLGLDSGVSKFRIFGVISHQNHINNCEHHILLN